MSRCKNKHRSQAAAVVTKQENKATLSENSKNQKHALRGDMKIRGVPGGVSGKMSSVKVKSLSFPILLALLLFHLTPTSSKTLLTPTHLASTACTTLKYYPAQVIDSYDTYSDISINQIDSKQGLIVGVGQAFGLGCIIYPVVFSTYSSTNSCITSESHKLSVMPEY